MSKLGAKIRLQTAMMLAHDIKAYRSGDVSRFDRMVDGRGKEVISLDIAKRNIIAICQEVRVISWFPITARLLLNWVEG